MKERRMQVVRVVMLVLVCVGLAIAGGASSDHHVGAINIQQLWGAQ